MDIPRSPIHAPDFVALSLNAGTINTETLRNRVLLIDFWDYTCVNCIRTLPYVTGWDRKYRDSGLTVLGIHAPEFSFAHSEELVREAIARFGIEYPVILDNQYQIWQAYANQYWPAKFLIDGKGYLRLRHFGEGAYQEMETSIQELLRELDPEYARPDLLPLLRETDQPGAVCYPMTPELYLGFRRGRLANAEKFQEGRSFDYARPLTLPEHSVALVGEWFSAPEFVAHMGEDEGRIVVRYSATEVNLVLAPQQGEAVEVELLQDGQPIPDASAGDDVRQSRLLVDQPRMYSIVRNPGHGEHVLELVSHAAGPEAYALTFGSCVQSVVTGS